MMDRPAGARKPALSLPLCVTLAVSCAPARPPDALVVQHARCRCILLDAARLADRAFRAVREERTRLGVAIDLRHDPAGSGLIGLEMSPVTTVHGDLGAKQTSANPNFAALVALLLLEAGVSEGDVVAASFSGSFPALNIAVHAAVRALGARLLAISGASASQWGANHPLLLWPDMERALHERGILSTRSVAILPGGRRGMARGLGAEGQAALEHAVARSGLPLLEARRFGHLVVRQMEVYWEHAGGRRIAAFVNVGGGATSVGSALGKRSFRPGLNLVPPQVDNLSDSVMARFAQQGVPVVHLVRVHELAGRYGLPGRPARTPAPGEGPLFDPGRCPGR